MPDSTATTDSARNLSDRAVGVIARHIVDVRNLLDSAAVQYDATPADRQALLAALAVEYAEVVRHLAPGLPASCG